MNSEAFQKAYAKLNTEQKEAVDTIEGPVMVNAGPGTGKTQILTLRIANILDKTDTKPEQVLALTFTNAGSFTMRERLTQYVGDLAYRVNIFTFHAFCEHVIKNNRDYFPNFEYAQVIDDLQKVKIIESIIDAGTYEYLVAAHDDYLKVRDIMRAIGTIKKEGLNPEAFRGLIPAWREELYADENLYYKRKYKEFDVGDLKPVEDEKLKRRIAQAFELADVYEKYQEELARFKFYDFSDMILTVLAKLKADDNFAFDLQEQYQYILVDEHQDTNMGQNELIELLTSAEHLNKRPNIFTVGDEKQSIYRFQGASEETFKHFNSLYEDIKHIALKENYRSVQHILSASHESVINSIPDAVALHANQPEDVQIEVGCFSNYKFELLYVAQEIKKKIDAGVSPEDIAILYRANKHLSDVKQVLAHAQIPFSVYSKDSVFEDADISNIITVLRVVLDPTDEESLGKALFSGFSGISGYDAVRILNARSTYARQGKKLFDIISSEHVLTEIGIEHTEPIVSFARCINEAITSSRNEHILEFLKNFLNQIGYLPYMLRSELSRDKMLRLDTLFDEIKKQNAKGRFGLPEFIKLVDSYHDYHIDIESGSPEYVSGVQLMTAHGSKGKEFEHVYIINTTRSNWEKSRSFGGITIPIKDYKGDEHDERRLFYVAMTRAKKGLSITYSASDWEGREQEKSQFIGELPEEHLSHIDGEAFEAEHLSELQLFIMPSAQSRTIYEPGFIKDLFMKKGLTVTALNNYLSCPIKYFYRNLVQIPSGYSAHMQYGNEVHCALEKFFDESRKNEKLSGKDRLIELFETEMAFSVLRDADRKKYLARGREALSVWYDNRASDLRHTVMTEQRIYKDFVLSSGETLKLHGIIDKIELLENELGGPVNLVDYKTGKPYSKKDKHQREDLKRQLTFYHILLEGYRDGIYHISQALLDFIEPNDKGQSELQAISVGESDIAELREVVDKTAHEIMRGEFLAHGCQKRDCEWCVLHNSVQKP